VDILLKVIWQQGKLKRRSLVSDMVLFRSNHLIAFVMKKDVPSGGPQVFDTSMGVCDFVRKLAGHVWQATDGEG